ncbi:MAG: phenylalanine--tRNA ligase subunit beta [Spirochaetales bacterium]
MFKYSRNWLEKLAKEKIDYKDFDKNWLDLQGFEVAVEESVGDDVVVTLEVKANRPDMLCHLGVLREYYVYKNKGLLPVIDTTVNLDGLKDLPIKVEIPSKDVGNTVLLMIENVNNLKSTPKEMVALLESFDVKSINPIVDISNYIMLEMGQPIHIYDADKVKNVLRFKTTDKKEKIVTLNGEEFEIPLHSILIEDEVGPACLAGMIGAKRVEVDSHTKNIIIEAAHFDPIRIRVTGQKANISTMASYRFERGVDPNNALNSAKVCAEKVLEVCGGHLSAKYVRLLPQEQNVKTLKVSKVNHILGSTLKATDIKNLLESYYYQVKILNSDTVEVVAPDYRLDIEQEIDVIGDIAQIYGYHNIEPTMPNLSVNYEPNKTVINSDILRNLMLAQGFNECISYSFINKDSMKTLGLKEGSKLYGEVELLNPLSSKFAVMRPNMLYSMLATYVYNLTINGECEPIFEIGTIFNKDANSDTCYAQKTVLSVLLNGNKYDKGFGLDKDIAYDFYDIKQILELITSEYSLNVELKNSNEVVFEHGMGTDIYINKEYAGYMGIVNANTIKNLENGKLIKGQVAYLELDLSKLTMGITRLEEVSKYPSIEREYNFLVPLGAHFEEYSKAIKKQSANVNNIAVKDIYKGKGVKDGFVSVLVSIEYLSAVKTLTSEEIEQIENKFYKELKEHHNIELKN